MYTMLLLMACNGLEFYLLLLLLLLLLFCEYTFPTIYVGFEEVSIVF